MVAELHSIDMISPSAGFDWQRLPAPDQVRSGVAVAFFECAADGSPDRVKQIDQDSYHSCNCFFASDISDGTPIQEFER